MTQDSAPHEEEKIDSKIESPEEPTPAGCLLVRYNASISTAASIAFVTLELAHILSYVFFGNRAKSRDADDWTHDLSKVVIFVAVLNALKATVQMAVNNSHWESWENKDCRMVYLVLSLSMVSTSGKVYLSAFEGMTLRFAPDLIVSLPYLATVLQAMKLEDSFTSRDMNQIACAFFAPVALCLAHIMGNNVMAGMLLNVGISIVAIWMYMTYEDMTEMTKIIDQKSEAVDFYRRGLQRYMQLLTRRKRLSAYALLPMFPSVGILFTLFISHVMDKQSFEVTAMLMLSAVKLSFLGTFSCSHPNTEQPKAQLISIEKKAELAKKSFINFVFHEVRSL
jgi:C4-dicarboxylate transporter